MQYKRQSSGWRGWLLIIVPIVVYFGFPILVGGVVGIVTGGNIEKQVIIYAGPIGYLVHGFTGFFAIFLGAKTSEVNQRGTAYVLAMLFTALVLVVILLTRSSGWKLGLLEIWGAWVGARLTYTTRTSFGPP